MALSACVQFLVKFLTVVRYDDLPMFSLLLTQSVPVPYKSEPLSGEEEQTGSERKHRDDPEINGREAAVNLRVFSEK